MMNGIGLTLASAAMAVTTTAIPPVGGPPPSVPAAAPGATPAADSPEEIAEDAARDIRENRFYNKPGASRADYEAAWQRCRLIARGSITPSRTVVTPYNPALISPAAAGIAGGIGGMIGAALAQGALRRANRQVCLLVDGWRLVEVSDEERGRLTAMTDAARSRYFDTVVGAADLSGKRVTEWTNAFAAPRLAPESEQ